MAQVPDKAADAGILAGEAVLTHQVLIDALGGQPELKLVENDLPPRSQRLAWRPGPTFGAAEPMGASRGVACFEPIGAPSGVACFELWTPLRGGLFCFGAAGHRSQERPGLI